MPRRTESAAGGFSLIEAAVAIAIMAILAGASLPLVMKAVNQQREQATRDSLKLAWQAAFGVQGSRVANMRADFGFNPTAALPDLGQLLTQVAPGLPTPPIYGPQPQAPGQPVVPFFYGWNGPYWNGSVATIAGRRVPVDAWGHAIQLLHPGATTWQLRSLGANNLPDNPATPQSNDDLYYPVDSVAPVVLASAYMATVYITFQAPQRQSASTGTWQWIHRSGGIARSTPAGTTGTAITVPAGGSLAQASISVMPGPFSLTAHFDRVPARDTVTPAPPAAPIPGAPEYPVVDHSLILDLLPGEARAITITLN